MLSENERTKHGRRKPTRSTRSESSIYRYLVPNRDAKSAAPISKRDERVSLVRPAAMHPEPLLGLLAHPALQESFAAVMSASVSAALFSLRGSAGGVSATSRNALIAVTAVDDAIMANSRTRRRIGVNIPLAALGLKLL